MTKNPFPLSITLSKRLDADADRADLAGEHGHAQALRQMAAYKGIHVRDHARDLGLHACAKDYTSAREVMELVVAFETTT